MCSFDKEGKEKEQPAAPNTRAVANWNQKGE
jgi:hypothetical protein